MTFLRAVLPFLDRRKRWQPWNPERRQKPGPLQRAAAANDKLHQSARGLADESTRQTEFQRAQVVEGAGDGELGELTESLKRFAEETLGGKDRAAD